MPVDATHRASAESIRSLLAAKQATPAVFRAALLAVPPGERDVWLDRVLGLESLPDDGPELPRGCVPYLPCAVDILLRMIDQADVRDTDVFVDIGAGVGRAALLVHLWTGATTIGLEIQPALVHTSRDLTTRLCISHYHAIEGDAVRLAGRITTGSIFFLYCPFSGARLEQVLDDLEPIARAHAIRICCVNLPLPPRPWLTLQSPSSEDLAIYRSTPPGTPANHARNS
jgi:hypothetical protein